VGSTIWGIVQSSLMWRYLSVANHTRSRPMPWDGSVRSCFNPASATGKNEAGHLTWINAPLSFLSYCPRMKDMIRDLPARLLAPDERTLVAEWLAGAGDIAEAYVSNRRGTIRLSTIGLLSS
jgi:hypothetical protein